MFSEGLGNIGNLKYFLSLAISNEETRAIVSRAIRNVEHNTQGYPAWGGYEFDTNTPEGQAILGSSCHCGVF